MQFEGFHWLSHHELCAIIQCSTTMVCVLLYFVCYYKVKLGSFVCIYYGKFLIKQLFLSRLLDLRRLLPTQPYGRRCPSIISYPTHARGIID